jgi:hypothetical protein
MRTPPATPRRAVLLAGALLLAAGCTSGSPTTSAEPLPAEESVETPTAPVTLRTGQSVRVGGPDALRITFERVEDDSRCPRAVVCVWAGDAAVRLRLDHPLGQEVATLHTGLDPKQAAHAGYVVRLLRLAPELPREGARPAYYEATLEVSRP